MLSTQANQVIANYLNLPFNNLPGVSCPYFNNKKSDVHGGLRVLVGKGSINDILEEALIISLRDKLDLNAISAPEIKKFLVDNHIGVDCSALVYYILDAELKALGLGTLKKYLHYPTVKNPIRKLLIKLRTVENTNVKVFANDVNSSVVEISDMKPGDIITMLGSGPDHDRDHILVVHSASSPSQRGGQGEVSPTIIHYTHSLQWRTDGKYNHGVRQGTITITDTKKPLAEQQWQEQGKQGAENETWERARFAESLEIRRLKALV